MANSFRDKVVEEGLEEPQTIGAEQQEAPADDVSSSATTQEAPKTKSARRPLFRMPKVSGKWAMKQLPLVGLIVLFCIILVSNRYKVEQLSKEKIQLERDIDYLREQRIQMQREYQESIKISRIAEKLDTIGVGLISGPPYEIVRTEEVIDTKRNKNK